MASELATAFVRVRPDLTGFKAEAAAGTREAGHALGKVFALAFGTVAVEELVRHVVTVAAKQDAMFAKVKQLTKSAGADWEVYGRTVQETIIAKSEKSGFAVDQLANAYGRLIQQTKDSKVALAALNTASDVARARGTAVTQVATSLTRAYAGNAQALSRLGIIVPKYTAGQDAVKAKLADLAQAQAADAQSKAKVYQGTIALTAEGQRYAAMSQVQRAQIALNLKAQLEQAKATDKTTGATKTLAEVSRRFKGQGDIFGESAAGQADRFSISIHELEVSIGEHLIPLLGRAAETGREWATALENSQTVGHGVEAVALGIASGVGAAADAIKTIYPVIKLSAEAISTVVGAIGAGPLLAAYAAYKAMVVVLGAVTLAEGKLAAVRAAGGAAAAGEVVSTEALVAAERQLGAAQLWQAAAAGTAAEAAAAKMVTDAELLVATEALTVAVAEEAAAFSALDLAMGFLLSPAGVLVGVAALAGGLFYLNSRIGDADLGLKHLRDTYGELNKALSEKSGFADAQLSRDQAKAEVFRANIALDTARRQQDADKRTGASSQTLAKDELAVRDAMLQTRQAALNYGNALTALDSAKAANLARYQAIKNANKELGDSFQSLATQVVVAAGIASGGAKWGAAVDQQRLATTEVKKYVAALDELVASTKNLDPIQKAQIDRLRTIALDTGRIPSQKTVRLILNDRAGFRSQLAFDAKMLNDLTANPFLIRIQTDLSGNTPEGFFGLKKLKPAALLDPAGFDKAIGANLGGSVKRQLPPVITTAFKQGVASAGPNIAAETATALSDGVTQAKQNLSSVGSQLGSDIASVLDAQLAASEAKLASSPAAQMVKQLTADAARLQARISGRDAQQQIDTTLKSLNDLKAAFGTGPHTAEQDAQLAAATNAYLNAQDSAAAAADTAHANSLQTQLDATKANLEKRNQAEKDATARRVADLNDQLNRGLIGERQYVTRLNAMLRREGVNYKAAGRLLGVAFADGFKEQLAGALAQARIIANLTPAQRGRGTGNAPTPVDPLALAAAKRKELQTQAAGAASSDPTAKNTADTVAELRKLGAIVKESKTHVTVTYPVGTSKKKAAEIVKLANAMKKGTG